MRGTTLLLAALFGAALPVAAQEQAPRRLAYGRGAEAAPVQIVVFCDYASRPCGELNIVLQTVLREFPEQVRIVFRQLPRESDRGETPLAYRAALAAGEQSRFWEMHDLLFANQERQAREDLIGMARQLELDLGAFAAALEGPDWPMTGEDREEALRLNATAVPAVFVNGKPEAARSFADFRGLLRQ